MCWANNMKLHRYQLLIRILTHIYIFGYVMCLCHLAIAIFIIHINDPLNAKCIYNMQVQCTWSNLFINYYVRQCDASVSSSVLFNIIVLDACMSYINSKIPWQLQRSVTSLHIDYTLTFEIQNLSRNSRRLRMSTSQFFN